MTFQNDVSTFVVIEKEADAGARAGTLTFKSGSASPLTATQDAWLKVTLTDGTVYKIPAFSDDVTP